MTDGSPDRPLLVALGASLGDRRAQLDRAVEALAATPGVSVVGCSGLYDTAPEGGVARERFLNAAVELETSLSPLPLLDALQAIEAAQGRVRRTRWEDRTLDLDIVLWGARVLALGRLTVPHPEMHLRRFVLAPLSDLAPDAVHPVLGRTLSELLAALPDEPNACVRAAPAATSRRWRPA